MMTELYKLDVKALVGQHYFTLKASREDLEENYPHKVDLIENLASAEKDVLNIKHALRMSFDELEKSNRRNYDVELINLKLQTRLNELELINKSLMKRVEL